MGSRQLVLRSVDSECEGHVIEPRKSCVGEAERRRQRGGNIETLQWSCVEIPPGSMRARAGAQGSPRNLGDPMVSAVESRKGHRRRKVQARRRPVSDLLWERIEGHHRGTAE